MENNNLTALAEKTNAYIKTFGDHAFKAQELKEAVPLRQNHSQQSQHTENFTRFTQDVTNMTGMTGQSDSVLVMDPEDRERAGENLQAFKDFVSTLKFAYLENEIKYQFVNHILSKDGPRAISVQENDVLEQQRLKTKSELRDRKRRAAELEELIREEADVLAERYDRTDEEAHYADQLLRDCQDMELKLRLLRNKRTEIQRTTIEEAQVLCEEQEAKIATFGPETKAVERKMKDTSSQMRARKLAIEKLAVLHRELKKEQDEREAKGKRDERAEEGCRWYTTSTALFSSLLGIRTAYTLAGPPTEMRIEYDSRQGQEGDIKILSILFSDEGRMVDAKLVDSSDSIEDLVETFLPSQDLTQLVQEVRARIGR